jgi:hypothetical protein
MTLKFIELEIKMVIIKLKNIGKSISSEKITKLFNLANNSSGIIKNGVVTIDKQANDYFSINNGHMEVGNIRINRRGNKIKNYTVSLKDFTGLGIIKIPSNYIMRTLSHTDIEPEYEEWSHTSIKNYADLALFYKVFHDKEKLHHFESKAHNYGNTLIINGIDERVVFKKQELPTQKDFEIIFLSYMAFNHQEVVINLFGDNQFKNYLNNAKLSENLDVLRMYHV